jgi:hypothetical protein
MMGRVVPKVLLGVWALSCAAAPAIGGQDEPGFPTNLGLLDKLADETVSTLLDSLEIQRGEKITVVAAGYNEGNTFIAEALARDLARRGAEVRLATESAPAPAKPETPPAKADTTPQDSTGVAAPAGADSARAGADSLAIFSNADSSGAAPLHVQPADTLSAEETEKIIEAKVAAEAAKAKGAGKEVAPEVKLMPPVVKPYPEGMVLEYRILEFGITYPVLKRRFILFGGASVRRLGGIYLTASRIQGPDGTILKAVKAQGHVEDFLPPRERLRAEGASYPFKQPVVPPANVGRYFEPVAVVGIVTSLVYLFYQNQN